jgi:hypothetical protein
MTNEQIAAIYGFATIAALALTLLSGRQVLIKLGLVLLLDWALYNVIVDWTGFERAPLLIPTFDTAIGIWVGIIAWTNRNLIGASVFGLFVVVSGWWAAELWAHNQATYLCFLIANVIFLAQVAMVGGAGGWSYLADRRARSYARLHPHPSRG